MFPGERSLLGDIGSSTFTVLFWSPESLFETWWQDAQTKKNVQFEAWKWVTLSSIPTLQTLHLTKSGLRILLLATRIDVI